MAAITLNYQVKHYFLLFLLFHLITLYCLPFPFHPFIYHPLVFSYQFLFPFISTVNNKSELFLQMYLNLNFPWFILNLGPFTVFHRHDFHMYHLYFCSCVSSTYTVSNLKQLLAEGRRPLRGGHRGSASKVVLSTKLALSTTRHQCNVYIIPSSNIRTTWATDFWVTDVSS